MPQDIYDDIRAVSEELRVAGEEQWYAALLGQPLVLAGQSAADEQPAARKRMQFVHPIW